MARIKEFEHDLVKLYEKKNVVIEELSYLKSSFTEALRVRATDKITCRLAREKASS